MKDKVLQRISLILILLAAVAAGISIISGLKKSSDDDVPAAVEIEPEETTETTLPPLEVLPEQPPETTEAAAEPRKTSAEYIGAALSENADRYAASLAVAGDSIASGFYHYGLIDSSHNIAQSSVSIWNLDYFTYNYGSGDLDTYEAVDLIRPALLYFSVGMNDVNMYTSEEYVTNYERVIKRLRKISPDTVIFAVSITPISETNDFIGNDVIREFNEALEAMINEMDDDHVWYFDAYSIVVDEDTSALRDDCSSGDGMHLAEHCYQDILDCLFSFIDGTEIKDNVNIPNIFKIPKKSG